MAKAIKEKYLKLKYLRERFGYSQQDFGFLIGVTAGQYSKKENGSQPWDLKECLKIRNKINEHLKAIGEDLLIIDQIFYAEMVSKTTRKKSA
jgi:DNA-binding XRE family transcriptional regulator